MNLFLWMTDLQISDPKSSSQVSREQWPYGHLMQGTSNELYKSETHSSSMIITYKHIWVTGSMYLIYMQHWTTRGTEGTIYLPDVLVFLVHSLDDSLSGSDSSLMSWPTYPSDNVHYTDKVVNKDVSRLSIRAIIDGCSSLTHLKPIVAHLQCASPVCWAEHMKLVFSRAAALAGVLLQKKWVNGMIYANKTCLP